MSAVWRASQAAVRRRRLQTFIIGVVVFFSTAMIVVALGLVAAASGPFDQAYAKRSGAHLVATYDSSVVSSAAVAATATRPGVASASGPFGERTLVIAPGNGPDGAMTVVGRSDPGGAVDRLDLWTGRWPTSPDEIVLNGQPSNGSGIVGHDITPTGGKPLRVVGIAHSVSESADAWVTAASMAALHPTSWQMLYRFSHAGTAARISSGQASVSAGLPKDALLGTQSWLALRANAKAGPGVYVPFLLAFGVLGLSVAILIVVNVVSGAVVSGFRHIGILKSLGFTPTQVSAVYLVMVCVPAAIGTILGTVVGNVAAQPVLHNAFEDYGGGSDVVAPWVDVVALTGMPLLVILAALAPSLRARRLSAAQALSAGSAQHSGRALAVQRWLSGTRLPRPASLGLGLPFARPARSTLTLAAVVLGAMSVTLAVGLTRTVSAFESARSPSKDRVQVVAASPQPSDGREVKVGPGGGGPPAAAARTLSDAGDEAMLRALPGSSHVVATAYQNVQVVGENGGLSAVFFLDAPGSLAPQLVKGHWPAASGEVVVNGQVLKDRGLRVGDNITLQTNARQARVKIVGDIFVDGSVEMASDAQTLALLAPGARADSYIVQVKHGTNVDAFTAAVRAGDAGLDAFPAQGGHSGGAKVVDAAATLLTLMLGAVAALGVFNTVVLNTRERRRDLGMLKSIGMTPRQVIGMLLTSMGVLGLLGGLVGVPLGIWAHRWMVPAMVHSGQLEVPGFLLNVFHAPLVITLGLVAVAIAVLGAFVPSRSAAWSPVADALHNE